MAKQVKLDDIVREFILSTGSDSLHQYPIFLQHAIRGLKNCDYDVSGVPRCVQLTLSSTNSATLPADFVKAIKFGHVDSGGRMIEIYKDDTIIPNPDSEVSTNGTNGIVNSYNEPPSNLFRNGEFIGRQYGHEGGSIYSLNINYEAGTVSFSSNVKAPVYVIYISDPKKVNGEYLVHPFLVEPVMRYIYYASIRFKKNVPRGEKDAAFRDFLNAKHHANVQFYSESAGSIVNASRKTFNQSIKY